MFSQMDQPSAKEIKNKERNDDRSQHIYIQPVYQSKSLRIAPVTHYNDQDSEYRVNEKMNNGKTKIYSCMAQLIPFILERDKRNTSFYDPKQQQSTNQQDPNDPGRVQKLAHWA